MAASNANDDVANVMLQGQRAVHEIQEAATEAGQVVGDVSHQISRVSNSLRHYQEIWQTATYCNMLANSTNRSIQELKVRLNRLSSFLDSYLRDGRVACPSDLKDEIENAEALHRPLELSAQNLTSLHNAVGCLVKEVESERGVQEARAESERRKSKFYSKFSWLTDTSQPFLTRAFGAFIESVASVFLGSELSKAGDKLEKHKQQLRLLTEGIEKLQPLTSLTEATAHRTQQAMQELPTAMRCVRLATEHEKMRIENERLRRSEQENASLRWENEFLRRSLRSTNGRIGSLPTHTGDIEDV